MCRWVAYRGETVTLEDYITAPAHSLTVQSKSALESTVATNGDGFGLGWYGQYDEPGLFHEVRPAWHDDNLHHLCRHIRSHLFFGHVRAATGTSVSRQNCHPFAYGRWMFMHNGYVGGWSHMRRAIEKLIPDYAYGCRGGSTDSEALFLAMIGAGLENDPIGATSRTLDTVVSLMQRAGVQEGFRFTAALSDGQDLYAFRYSYGDSANTLYYSCVPSGVVVVSEPLDRDLEKWQRVPENSFLIARAGQRPQLHPLCAGLAAA